MIRISTLVPTDKNRASAAASNRANWEGEFAEERWALDPIDMMSVADFVQMLEQKFGPEYFMPIAYHWQGGKFLPVVATG